jgi:hypothetical protein
MSKVTIRVLNLDNRNIKLIPYVYRSRKAAYDLIDGNEPYFKTDKNPPIGVGYTFFSDINGIKSYVDISGFSSYWKVTKKDGTTPFKLKLLNNNFLQELSLDVKFQDYFQLVKNVFKKQGGKWVRISETAEHDREFFTKLFREYKNKFIGFDGVYTKSSDLHPHEEYVIFGNVEKIREIQGTLASYGKGSPKTRMGIVRVAAPSVKKKMKYK